MDPNIGLLLILIAFSVSLLLYLGNEIKAGNRKRAEAEKLALVATKTDQAVLIVNPEGMIEWANDGFSRISGHGTGELIGKPAGDVLLGPLHSQSQRTIQQIRNGLTTGRNFTVEMRCAHKDGNRYWFTLHFTPVLNEQRKLVNFVGLGAEITARKCAEDELVRVNRRHELLLNAAEDGILGLDLQGHITFANPAAARITGWDTDELVGKPASLVFHQLHMDKLPTPEEDHVLAAVFREGVTLIGDTDLFRRKDGSNVHVDYTSTTIREGNNSIGAVIVFRDVTDRRQSEFVRVCQGRQFALRADVGFALAESNTLRNILQKCAQAVVKHLDGAFARVWTLNAEDNILELEASAGIYTHIDGHHSRIPCGTHKVGLLAKQGLPEMTNDLANDPNVTDKDWVKREKMVSFAGFPLFVENRLIGVMALYSRNRLPDDTLELLGSIIDSIAQGIVRKRAEDKVAEQAALLDKAQDAIFVLDLANRCTYWNKSAERLYGWSTKEACGKKADELIYRDSSYFDRTKKEVLEKGEWMGECCQVTRGDESVVVESHWTLVQDDAGNPKSILVVNTDLTEKKKIEAQFLRTQRMESIGTLAGGIAHDLNNVLAPILMSVEILKQKFKDEQCKRILSVLESSARRGADMVRQVLTFARGVEGERALLQTRHLLKEVAKIVGETFPKTIQIKTNIAEDLWTIMGDATQLHQVLLNLAVNARDAMPDGGTISINAENTIVEANQEQDPANAKPGSYIVIKVTDSGTGIPRDILDKIFEPFFTTKDLDKGTGLGLPTVLGIVKNHGGFLQVQTEVKKGTTFLIYLPAQEAEQKQPAEIGPPKLPLGQGELILAVDDDASVLSMTKEALETFGYRVVTAKDGAEAVATYSVRREEIKGVLTDMIMPFMDGPDTIRALRKMDPTVKIIAASGLMDGEKVKDATGMDNITFLMKPYTAEKLLHSLHKLLCN